MSIRPLVSVNLAVEREGAADLLEALQSLGVAHIKPLTQADVVTPALAKTVDPEQLRQALRYLDGVQKFRRQQECKPSQFTDTIKTILSHKTQRSALQARLDFLKSRIKDLTPWGDFEWPPLQDLSGYRLWFYRLPSRNAQALEGVSLPWQQVHRTPDYHYVVVLSNEEPEKDLLPVPRVHTGPVRLSELKSEQEQCLDQLEQMDIERANLTRWYSALQRMSAHIQDETQKHRVLSTALNQSDFMGVSFWMDPIHTQSLTALCKSHLAACVVQPIGPNDHPPTLLSNPSFFSGGQTAVQFFQVPSYRSWDPSRVVFFSFAFFFALIISDFGYSALMATVLALFTKRLSRSEKGRKIRGLLWVTVTFAMLWGVLVGSYFGAEPDEGWLAWAHLFDLRDFNNMIALSITIGVGHLVIANGVMAWVRRKTSQCWSSVGWCLLLLSALWSYLISTHLFGWAVMLVGGLLIVFFNSDHNKIATRLMAGMMDLTRLTTLLGNALSYLRLFALGLASASMALTFNQLAVQVLEQLPGVGLVLAGLILFLGHLLNFALTVVSGVIHGLRLNLIEFFNWSLAEEGYIFEPFRKQEVTPWTDS
jgi:V/A-type H+-transporting ATPase subunit I